MIKEIKSWLEIYFSYFLKYRSITVGKWYKVNLNIMRRKSWHNRGLNIISIDFTEAIYKVSGYIVSDQFQLNLTFGSDHPQREASL